MSLKRTASLLCAALLLFTATGCQKQEGAEKDPVASIDFQRPAALLLELDNSKSVKLIAKCSGSASLSAEDFQWVSTNPDVLAVAMDDTFVNLVKGVATPKEPGLAEVYCQSADGKVQSQPQLFKVVQSKQEVAADEDSCTVTALQFADSEARWFSSDTAGRSASVTLQYEAAFREDYPYIQLESSHPEVAAASLPQKPVPLLSGTGYRLSVELQILQDGETEITARTPGGEVVSIPLKIVVGNSYNPASIAKSDLNAYLLSHVHYPSKGEYVVKGARPSYIRKDHLVLRYRYVGQGSSVTFTDFAVGEDGRVLADGYISTFNESGQAARCVFSLEVQYSEDWKDYDILKEEYSDPDLVTGVGG